MKLLFSFSQWGKNTLLLCWTIILVSVLVGCASQSARSNAAPVAVGEGYYRVQQGDNLYRIGLKYNQNVNQLMQWNHLQNADMLEVGQVIRVKKPVSATHSVTPQKTKQVPKKQTTVSSGGGIPNVSLIWPVRGQVITKFNGHTQKGIDIAGSRGTPVKAAAAGTVQYAGEELRGYGKLILIKHSATTMTAYAYNDRLLVRNGQRVSAGQQIATMGNSGGVDRVKLHFEVRVNSQAIDPIRYLPN